MLKDCHERSRGCETCPAYKSRLDICLAEVTWPYPGNAPLYRQEAMDFFEVQESLAEYDRQEALVLCAGLDADMARAEADEAEQAELLRLEIPGEV